MHNLNIVVAIVHPDNNGQSVKTFSTTWSLMAGLSPPPMSPTQTWGTQSQVPVGSFLASICPVRPALNHFCSNTHLPFPHVLLPDSYGNLLIDQSTQFHWPATTHTLPIKTAPRWQLHCLNQPHTLPAQHYHVEISYPPCWLQWNHTRWFGRDISWWPLPCIQCLSIFKHLPDILRNQIQLRWSLLHLSRFTIWIRPLPRLHWLIVIPPLTTTI